MNTTIEALGQFLNNANSIINGVDTRKLANTVKDILQDTRKGITACTSAIAQFSNMIELFDRKALSQRACRVIGETISTVLILGAMLIVSKYLAHRSLSVN